MRRRAARRREPVKKTRNSLNDAENAHRNVTEEVHTVHRVSSSDEDQRTLPHNSSKQHVSSGNRSEQVDLTWSDSDPNEFDHAKDEEELEEVDCDLFIPETNAVADGAGSANRDSNLNQEGSDGEGDGDMDMDDVDVDMPMYSSLYETQSQEIPSTANSDAELTNDLNDNQPKNHVTKTPSTPSMHVVLNAPTSSATSTAKRRTAPVWTPRDRKNRILMHEIHVLSILAAARIRNRWCNDEHLRETLLQSVPDHLLHKLHAIHPKREPERRERVRLFEALLHDLVRWWASRFRLHASHSSETAWRQPNQDLVVGRKVPPHTWVDGWVTETPSERAERHKTAFSSKARRKLGRFPMELALFPPGTSTATPTYLRLLPSAAPKSPQDLLAAANAHIGTHETSAMLFCALCRSMGIPARLVVSVQVGPCTAAAAKTPATAGGNRRELRSSEQVVSSDEHGSASDSDFSDTKQTKLGSNSTPSQLRPTKRRKKAASSSLDWTPSDPKNDRYYVEPLDTRAPPTMWVEVFSKPYQHWITMDPIRALVRVTGNKHMEPMAIHKQNRLVYVVGFEEDGYGRDVTARYTRALHTKVAKQRPSGVGRASILENDPQATWWASVVRAIHRPQQLDRDAIEDTELADASAREPMPTSVGAFKDHPVYCLERFLRRDQVLHPPNRVGTFQGAPVYLRANVVQLQSARQWYNQGRAIVEGEQPLKMVKSRAYTLQSKRVEEQARAEGQDSPMEGLYSYAQTQTHVPLPVTDGIVPKNAFGHVDLFVPSMLPKGGTHIPHRLGAKAAKSLKVSYAEAVVGFEFRKFRSMPRVQGVVVPEQHADAVWKAVHLAEEQAAESEQAKRQARAIKAWRKFLTALTVAKRIHEQYGASKATAQGSNEPSHPSTASRSGGGSEQDSKRPDASQQATVSQLRFLDHDPELDRAKSGSETGSDIAPKAPEHHETPDSEQATVVADRPIVSLDELMALDAKSKQPSSVSASRTTSSLSRLKKSAGIANEQDLTTQPSKRRRIVLKRASGSAIQSQQPTNLRRSTRSAAQNARNAFQTESSPSDDEHSVSDSSQ
ncbi:hypothetical protein MYAM1_003855 [Malassezia yamatoensis]|uniref:Rad4-domain-containing protein n=1 Tax=Malassezia yamatoensis TaxID=253288 RepID=A0AAJ5YXJ7_9BASI|nr:hypothetical protein MYAM1_003855 [Malassezia yamatoensis]